jgi:hypothetical protein
MKRIPEMEYKNSKMEVRKYGLKISIATISPLYIRPFQKINQKIIEKNMKSKFICRK